MRVITKNQRRIFDVKRSLRAGRVGVVIAISAAAVLSACGSDNNSKTASTAKISCATGSIDGAGSTFVQPIAQQWVKDYQGACPGTVINYKGGGSGAGITQLGQGAVSFAASDVQPSDSDKTTLNAKYGSVTTLPWAAGAIALEYKLTGVEAVRLSPATIAGIFQGTIKTWNDPAIAADNSGRVMPTTPIQVMHRSDGSGTTAVLTQFMTANAPEVWKAGTGKDIPAWPTGQGLKGSDGVTAAVKQTEGAIGYSELSFAKANALPTATIKNVAGNYVAADSAAGVTAALKEATVDNDANVTANFKPQDPTAYPLSTFTYVILPKANDDKATLLRSFVTYAIGDGQGQAAALSYAPLPADVATKVKTKLTSLNSAG